MIQQIVETLEVTNKITLSSLKQRIQKGEGILVAKCYHQYRKLVEVGGKWGWQNLNEYGWGLQPIYSSLDEAFEKAQWNSYEWVYCQTFTDFIKWLVKQENLDAEDLEFYEDEEW